MGITENAEGDWWSEDSDRINRLADLARQKGMTVPVAPKQPMKIQPNGSVRKPTKKKSK